jgi:hypothetical protein
MARHSPSWLVAAACLLAALAAGTARAADGPNAAAGNDGLRLAWAKNILTISGRQVPGGEIRILYLEAYCRPGSTDRDWHETVIGHATEVVEASDDGRTLRLLDRVRDGIVVRHAITARDDEVDFRLVAHNPTEVASQAHWVQPCVRVDKFTGCGLDDARSLVPAYARKSFIFLDGKLARFPTEPWADKARYIPGQVYSPRHVDRNDVNPRPLSKLVPSNGLIGCFSADEKLILATAWEPYQELFQGVLACLHSDFRIGGLAPGQTKEIRGKLYIVDADVKALVGRYEKDFPEHAGK